MMNFVQEEKGYGNNEEEEEEEEEEDQVSTPPPHNFPFFSSSSSSSHYKTSLPPWLQTSDFPDHPQRSPIHFNTKLHSMELSLSTNPDEPINTSTSPPIEKEHMFDKVVTPSDVGKLNRLVIPKQHAEKYFPLDSSSTEKGLLLNFEDRNGKPWRFRYSYWNSSQSYVMTKGWSRFVKEKKLDAGDIVSFQRGVGEAAKHLLYIDWRRRPDAPDLSHLHLPNQHLQFPQSVRWGRLYSLPQSMSTPHNYDHFQHLNYNIYPYHQHYRLYQQQQQQQQQQQAVSFGNVVPYYLRRPTHQIGGVQERNEPMLVEEVPVVEGKSVAKRLRLFGVNMECPIEDESSSTTTNMTHGTIMGSLPSPQIASSSLLSRQHNSSASFPTMQAEFSNKGKSSLSFDLDP